MRPLQCGTWAGLAVRQKHPVAAARDALVALVGNQNGEQMVRIGELFDHPGIRSRKRLVKSERQ